MKIKKRSLEQIDFRPAPNRKIGEVFSEETWGALGVTFRIVDMEPVAEQAPRRPHMHADFEEVIYFMHGRGRIWAAGEWLDVSAGDTVLIPPGVLHATFNVSDESLRLMCFFPVPAGVNARTRGEQYVTFEPG